MKRYTLTPVGFEKISKLQDKYRYQDTFEILETDEAIEFLEGLRQLYYSGLNIDSDDLDWIEEALDILTSTVDDK